MKAIVKESLSVHGEIVQCRTCQGQKVVPIPPWTGVQRFGECGDCHGYGYVRVDEDRTCEKSLQVQD